MPYDDYTGYGLSMDNEFQGLDSSYAGDEYVGIGDMNLDLGGNVGIEPPELNYPGPDAGYENFIRDENGNVVGYFDENGNYRTYDSIRQENMDGSGGLGGLGQAGLAALKGLGIDTSSLGAGLKDILGIAGTGAALKNLLNPSTPADQKLARDQFEWNKGISGNRIANQALGDTNFLNFLANRNSVITGNPLLSRDQYQTMGSALIGQNAPYLAGGNDWFKQYGLQGPQSTPRGVATPSTNLGPGIVGQLPSLNAPTSVMDEYGILRNPDGSPDQNQFANEPRYTTGQEVFLPGGSQYTPSPSLRDPGMVYAGGSRTFNEAAQGPRKSPGSLFAHGGEVVGGLGAVSQPRYFQGSDKGQADTRQALVSDGEYVFDADTVAALGDGNNEAGASVLNQMRENIRRHKRSAPAHSIPPKAKNPEAYLPKKGKK